MWFLYVELLVLLTLAFAVGVLGAVTAVRVLVREADGAAASEEAPR